MSGPWTLSYAVVRLHLPLIAMTTTQPLSLKEQQAVAVQSIHWPGNWRQAEVMPYPEATSHSCALFTGYQNGITSEPRLSLAGYAPTVLFILHLRNSNTNTCHHGNSAGSNTI